MFSFQRLLRFTVCPSQRPLSMFISQKVLHKQGLKSFAYRNKQSGLMSLSGLSSSLLAWALGSPQVFLTKQEVEDEEKKISSTSRFAGHVIVKVCTK